MPEKNNNEFVFPANLALTIEEEPSFSEQQKTNAYAALCRYLIFETEPTDITLRMFCKAVKASIENEKKRKKQISELKRNCVLQRWNKQRNQFENQNDNQIDEQIETITPENKFITLTDNNEIRNALSDSESTLNVFLATGSGYDELTIAEREFVDRADVRSNCRWHKEIQAATKAIKTKIPTEEEVLEYARQQNSIAGIGGFSCSDEEALNFYDYYSGIGWVMPNDARTPIINWKPFLRKWTRNPLRPQKQFAPRVSLKDIKEMDNHIKLEKLLKGEAL